MPPGTSSTSRSRFTEFHLELPPDPYVESVAARKLGRARAAGCPLRIACLDIDSTLTGDDAATDKVRARLETLGYIVVFDTSRTEEMLMTEDVFAGSGDIERPPPLLETERGQHVRVPPETVLPRGILDGDILAASTGTRVLVRQESGQYVVDSSYEARHGATPHDWRAAAEHMLDQARARGCSFEPAAIESQDNYRTGTSDVAPPLFRIQINFSDLDAKLRFVGCLRNLVRSARANIIITDDSKPDTAIKVFLSPRSGSKERAITHIVRCLQRVAGADRGDVSILFAGDSFPDLKMGLLGAPGVEARFLLVGGSRLANALAGGDATFAGEKVGAVARRLRPTDRPGYLTFVSPCAAMPARTVIVGDFAYPGTEAVHTVARFLESCS